MMSHDLPDNTPVLVSYASVEENTTDLSSTHEASELMTLAAKQAAAKVACEQLLRGCDRIYVPEGMWSYRDPARLVAEGIEAASAKTVFVKVGITQQSLMSEACQRIQQGLDEIVLVAGGEAKFRNLQARIQGVAVEETQQPETTHPDITLQPDDELWLPEEAVAGLGMPVSYYALMDSAYRASRGWTIDEHRDYLADMYAAFSRVAAENPHAWKRQAVDAAFIRNASEKNPMLAFPYTKLHNTSWNVNQACALFFTSLKKARSLGIDEKHFVYPWVASENNAMLAVAERPELHRSPGAELAAQAVLSHSGLEASDIGLMDLYSCFPYAVEIYADAFGFDNPARFTCTGGMPFAGGPLNNYALQAACRVFELLEQQPSAIGLTSSVSGLLTKQAFGLWSKKPPNKTFALLDVSEQVRAQELPRTVIGAYSGSAVVVGYTVTWAGQETDRLIAICDLPDGKRTVCYSEDKALAAAAMVEEFCGRTVMVEEGMLFGQHSAR